MWIETLTDWITRSQALIIAISGAMTTLIAAYKAVMIAWRNRGLEELRTITIKLIAQAEKGAEQLYYAVGRGKDIDPRTNEGKTLLVAMKLQRLEPKLLKRCKLNDLPALHQFIHNTYQQVKPVVKALQ